MKKHISLLTALLFALIIGCSGTSQYHEEPMPDPKSFNAHFGHMDDNGDGRVTWDEFKDHFSHAQPKVFNAIDLNQDKALDHDEWHEFKDAHGLRHHH